MQGKLSKPVKVISRCGAIGHIVRYDPECLYPYVVEHSEKTQKDYPVMPLQSHDLEGCFDQSLGTTKLDITHYFVGKIKVPIYELEKELVMP